MWDSNKAFNVLQSILSLFLSIVYFSCQLSCMTGSFLSHQTCAQGDRNWTCMMAQCFSAVKVLIHYGKFLIYPMKLQERQVSLRCIRVKFVFWLANIMNSTYLSYTWQFVSFTIHLSLNAKKYIILIMCFRQKIAKYENKK